MNLKTDVGKKIKTIKLNSVSLIGIFLGIIHNLWVILYPMESMSYRYRQDSVIFQHMYLWDLSLVLDSTLVLPIIISTIIGVYYGVNKKNTINTLISGIIYGIGFLISSILYSCIIFILIMMVF